MALKKQQQAYGSISTEDVTRILDVTRKLAQPHELHELLDYVVDAGTSVLSAEKGALWLFDAVRNKLVIGRRTIVEPAPLANNAGVMSMRVWMRKTDHVMEGNTSLK